MENLPSSDRRSPWARGKSAMTCEEWASYLKQASEAMSRPLVVKRLQGIRLGIEDRHDPVEPADGEDLAH